jgi:hypothetical protein
MKSFPILLATTLASAAALAQTPVPPTKVYPTDTPMSQEDLLKQIDDFSPIKGVPKGHERTEYTQPNPAFLTPLANGDIPKAVAVRPTTTTGTPSPSDAATGPAVTPARVWPASYDMAQITTPRAAPARTTLSIGAESPSAAPPAPAAGTAPVTSPSLTSALSAAVAPNSQAIAKVAAGAGTIIGSGIAPPPATPDDQEKGPTIVDALEATFDQRANIAVFVGEVVVKDPEFNIWADKVTAYLKHDDKDAPAAKGAKVTPKPVTPAPTPMAKGGTPPPKRGGGLDHAVAVMLTPGGRVKITQDKVDAQTGRIKHGIGFADRAEYFTDTGDIRLFGSPDVTQDKDRCVATAPYTVITMNRDGHMTAVGPHRTFIVDDTQPATDANGAPRPAATPPPATPRPATPPPQ